MYRSIPTSDWCFQIASSSSWLPGDKTVLVARIWQPFLVSVSPGIHPSYCVSRLVVPGASVARICMMVGSVRLLNPDVSLKRIAIVH